MDWFKRHQAWAVFGLSALFCWPQAFDAWVNPSQYIDPPLMVWGMLLMPPIAAVLMALPPPDDDDGGR